MPLPFALDHINLWLLRDRSRRRPRRLGHRRLRRRQRDDARRVGERLRPPPGRPAGAARDRHAHASRPHRQRPLAHRALGLPAVDQRDRLERGAHREHVHHRLWRRRRGGLLRRARAGRPRGPREGARPRRLLRVDGAAGAAPVPPDDGRPGDAHRRQRLALHRRLRPCAGAHLAALPRAGRADLGRHGAAAHLHQHQRDRPRARGRSAAAVPGVDRADAHAARGHAGAAVARQAVPRTARARATS